MTKLALTIAAVLAAGSAAAPATAAATFTTLGTGSGPRPNADRAQPANLLVSGDTRILIDVGDGAAQQLGKVGVPLESVATVFLSHLHFDHTGGLFAYLARRYQLRAPGVATIYGPPGTRATVEALCAAIVPGARSAANISARNPIAPADTVRVVEIGDGWHGVIGDVQVRAAANTHYALNRVGPTKNDTFAFRFDTPGRSLVYTGDTGPSPAIEVLAKGADVMFAEIIDTTATLRSLKASRTDLDAATLASVESHYRLEHLSPDDVGQMAAHAAVHELVLTHDAVDEAHEAAARATIASHFSGRIIFAVDLQKF